MKKKINAALIILCMCIGLLPGCEKEPEAETSDSQETVQNTINIEETFLSNKSPYENSDNLYEIQTEWMEGLCEGQVHRVGEDLLVTYAAFDETKQSAYYKLKIVSLKTGEVLREQQLDSMVYASVQILEEAIAIHDLGDGTSYLLDQELNLVDTYDLSGGLFCMDPSGQAAYRFTYDPGIKKVDLKSFEETVLMENAINTFMYEVNEEEVTFSYTDSNTLLRKNGILNLSTGQIEVLDSPFAYNALETGHNIWAGRVEADEPIYVLSDGTNQNLFYADFTEWISVNDESGHMIIEEKKEDGTLLSAYDNQGNLVSSCEAAGLTSFVQYPYVWFEEDQGYLFILTDTKGQDHLLYWDVSAGKDGDNLELQSVEALMGRPDGTAADSTYFEKAEALSDKYDVEILIADQCTTEFTDHRGELLLEEDAIEMALNTVDQVLGMYPEGFFTQLKHNTYGEIEIQILGVLEKDYSTETEKYISGGFVTTAYPGKLVMALDARPDMPGASFNKLLAGTMYHEFSHIIDKRLEYVSQYRTDSVYSESGWQNHNPDGFEYNDTYYGTLDPQYGAYFIDAYSCTNSTEDRARIMEYAMLEEADIFKRKNGAAAKLEYYCASIRDSFDTAGWPDELPWEKTLNRVK